LRCIAALARRALKNARGIAALSSPNKKQTGDTSTAPERGLPARKNGRRLFLLGWTRMALCAARMQRNVSQVVGDRPVDDDPPGQPRRGSRLTASPPIRVAQSAIRVIRVPYLSTPDTPGPVIDDDVWYDTPPMTSSSQ